MGYFMHSLKLQPGENVVILDCEHPNQAYGWLSLRSLGVEVRQVPTESEKDGFVTTANANTFAAYVDDKTRAIGISSIMFHSGQWNDVTDICAAYRPRGIHVLADLTQQVGFTDVDVQALGVSAAAFSLHKGLNCPLGLAALYVHEDFIRDLDPTPPIVGYGSVSNTSEDFMIPNGPIEFHPSARRYEHANMNLMAASAARAFLQFYLDIMGPEDVKDHLYSLGDALREKCKRLGMQEMPVQEAANSTFEGMNESPDLATQAQSELQLGLDGSLIYHGPTSIYRAQTGNQAQRAIKDSKTQPPLYSGSESNFSHVLEHFGINIDDEVIAKALMQFFKWQYPQFMFIYREGFLRDHLGDRVNCKYWSSALLLSICALGTLMSTDEEDRRSSEQFFTAAESILMVTGMTMPSIVTVQAFLCLAFYEIGRGNLSKGWGFSGIAFRIAQDLGFQKDPKNWISYDASLTTDEDVEIRRRIYWGCYISDKLISLILGRPVFLYYDDAEVEPIQQQPCAPFPTR
ncbi:hypothetical protein G7Z17_g4101 [Cylindrodendrum hubeiense]|uniref:Xylanolytic transcriptional activator regulatory domain-containing protein n=1 Tax=Cylindrodendrum hubeiense TaxID=595255 RepID=A0A9P5H9K2_9HYPO|nr:hypothetical protein G7Z17_g4101 [Cylindrodendrum hubeiense]